MHDNHAYNLMNQLVQEQKSLWRIENHYIAEADCEDCEEFWRKMAEDKEAHIKELTALIKEHI